MLKKEIAFEDFEGNKKVTTEYFHMSKVELVKLYGKDGGQTFMDHMQTLIDKEDTAAMIESMETMVLAAYGKRLSDDVFDKGEILPGQPFGEHARKFKGSPAFDVLIFEFMTNASAASDFLLGVIPRGMVNEKNSAQMKMMASEIDSGARPVKEIVSDMESHLTPETSKPKKIDRMLTAMENKAREDFLGKKAYEEYSEEELLDLSADEFNTLVGTDVTKMTQDQFNMAHRRRQLGR